MNRPGPEPLARSPVDERPLAEPNVSQPKRSFLAELPVLMLIAFGLALLLKTFVIQAFFIPSRSMEPTLLIGDRVLVNKVVYDLREPQRGEVVVFTHEDGTTFPEEPDPDNPFGQLFRSLGSGLGLSRAGEKDFIKRIVGQPGDTVEMRDGIVYVNGQPLPEATMAEGGYLSMRDQRDFGPITVKPDHYFVMGDNRPNSDDSRGSLGQIPRQAIIGRAFVIIWPLGHVDVLPRPEYGLESAMPPVARGAPGIAIAAVLPSVR